MKYRLLKNRNLVEDKEFLNKNKWFVGYDKENRAEVLEFEIPDTLNDYAKKINFDLGTEKVSDILDQDNTYILKNNITQYKQVSFYLEFVKEIDNNTTEILKTEVKTIEFGDSFDVNTEITEEEISIIDTLIAQTNSAINRANAISQDLENKVATDYYRGATGEKGEDGVDGQDGYTPQKGIDYFTEQDIEEIEGDILNEVYTKSEADTLLDEKADIEDIPDVSNFITKDVNNLTNYTLKTNTGSLIDLEINDTTYVVTLKLKNLDGTIISADTIDLPLESVVVSGRYDNTTKKVILTLENGSEVDFSVADLVAGLQTEITSSNKLASDLVDDTNSGNKFVTTSEKQTWNNKYDKPNGGIPKTDLASTVQTSLNKADTAIQEHQDISGKEDKTNKVTSIDNTSTDIQYPSAKCVHDSQATQDDEIEALQTENARLKATLPTTTGEGQDITLDKTAELEFKKPPLPMGNSEQNGEPRPDNEVFITNVTGNVEVTISNENNAESKTLPVSLGNIELCKIGDYQDYFYKESNKWYLHKEINKVVFNGSESWNYNAQNNVAYLQLLTKVSSKKGLFSNLFSYYNADWTTAPDNTISEAASSNYIFIKSTVASNISTWKSWLSTHNTIVYYVLATPTDTEITDTTLISQLEAINNAISYEEQTNIIGSSDESNPIFDVEAYQSTKLILEVLKSKIPVELTQQEYDALVTKDSNTYYYIVEE